MSATKTCTVCQEPLPLSSFHKCALGQYGVRGTCKSCRAKSYQPEPARAAAKRYYQANKAQRNAYVKKRRLAAKALK